MVETTEASLVPSGSLKASNGRLYPRTVGQPYARIGKRALDLAICLALLPVAAPLVLVAALVVARDGGNPFYIQPRVGRNGRVFRMVKLRSMVPDAEAKLHRLLDSDPALAAEWAVNQKLKDDPRITWIGRFLRRTSLDELPQLWNVVLGHMSLVGPRPMMPEQAELYPGSAYSALRPGMTGPWQVSERHDSAFATRAEYDADYLDSVSLATDLRLLSRTVAVVLRGTGC